MSNEATMANIKAFIQSHALGVLGTVDGDGVPSGAAVYFGVDDSLQLYFSTKSETQKNQNIVENPRVSVTFTDEASQVVLQITGVAEALKNSEERDTAVQALSDIKHLTTDWLPPLPKIDAGYYVVYKVVVRYARISDFSNRQLGEGAVVYEYKNEKS